MESNYSPFTETKYFTIIKNYVMCSCSNSLTTTTKIRIIFGKFYHNLIMECTLTK